MAKRGTNLERDIAKLACPRVAKKMSPDVVDAFARMSSDAAPNGAEGSVFMSEVPQFCKAVMPMWRTGSRAYPVDVVRRGMSARIMTRPTYNVFYPMRIVLKDAPDWVVDDVLVGERSFLGGGRSVRADLLKLDELASPGPPLAIPTAADFYVDVTYVGHSQEGSLVVGVVIGAMSSVYCVDEDQCGGTRFVLPRGVKFEDLPWPPAAVVDEQRLLGPKL